MLCLSSLEEAKEEMWDSIYSYLIGFFLSICLFIFYYLADDTLILMKFPCI